MRIWQPSFAFVASNMATMRKVVLLPNHPRSNATTYGPRTNHCHAHRFVLCFSFLVINYSLLVAVTVASQGAKCGDGAIGFIRLKTRTPGKLLTH